MVFFSEFLDVCIVVGNIKVLQGKLVDRQNQFLYQDRVVIQYVYGVFLFLGLQRFFLGLLFCGGVGLFILFRVLGNWLCFCVEGDFFVLVKIIRVEQSFRQFEIFLQLILQFFFCLSNSYLFIIFILCKVDRYDFLILGCYIRFRIV